MTDDLTFAGWDLAMNHSGAVLLDEDGEVADFQYRTNQRGAANQDKGRSSYYNPKGPTDERNMARLEHNALWCRSIQRLWNPSYSYLEGYAFGTPKGELTGEVAGAWKLQMWAARRPFRIMDIASIKMFAAHKGNASKEQVMDAVTQRWDQSFGHLNKPWSSTERKDRKTGEMTWTREPKDLRQTEEDLSDAYTMARMCWTEYMIRAGRIGLEDLEDNAERRVYLRATKAHPVNVLARPWTQRA